MDQEPADRAEHVPPELQRAAAALGATSAGRAPRKPAQFAVDEVAAIQESVRMATDGGPAPSPPEAPVERI